MRIFNNPASKNVLSSIKNEANKSFIKKGNISGKISTISNTPLRLNPQGNYFEGLKANPHCKISGYPKLTSDSLLKTATEKAKNSLRPPSILNEYGTAFRGMIANAALKIPTRPKEDMTSLAKFSVNVQQNQPLRPGMLNRHGNLFQGHIPNPDLKINGSTKKTSQEYELDDLFIYDEIAPYGDEGYSGIPREKTLSRNDESYSDIFSDEPLFRDDNSDSYSLPAFSHDYEESDKNRIKENAPDRKDYYKIYYEQD